MIIIPLFGLSILLGVIFLVLYPQPKKRTYIKHSIRDNKNVTDEVTYNEDGSITYKIKL